MPTRLGSHDATTRRVLTSNRHVLCDLETKENICSAVIFDAYIFQKWVRDRWSHHLNFTLKGMSLERHFFSEIWMVYLESPGLIHQQYVLVGFLVTWHALPYMRLWRAVPLWPCDRSTRAFFCRNQPVCGLILRRRRPMYVTIIRAYGVLEPYLGLKFPNQIQIQIYACWIS